MTTTFAVDVERKRDAVARAAKADLATLLDRLNEPFDSDEMRETLLARIQVAQLALALPAASIGSCGYDGSDLTFRGRKDGLWVCCTAVPEHCWKNS